MPRFVTKIIGGKLVTVPEYRDSTSAQTTGHSVTYPWAKYDPVRSQKIGSRTYPVLPPISDGKFKILCKEKQKSNFLFSSFFLFFKRSLRGQNLLEPRPDGLLQG
mgnify:CR=1 FL=1